MQIIGCLDLHIYPRPGSEHFRPSAADGGADLLRESDVVSWTAQQDEVVY
jgi:hypothetical protein